jgi:ribosomal subunit interface protein
LTPSAGLAYNENPIWQVAGGLFQTRQARTPVSGGTPVDVTISGRHVAVTDAMREHARQRAEKLATLSQHLMRAKITLSIEPGRQIAEVIASVRRHGEMVAKSESHDMYAAIDAAIAKIEKQLHRIEDRFRAKRDAARQKRTSRGAPEPPAGANAEEEE